LLHFPVLFLHYRDRVMSLQLAHNGPYRHRDQDVGPALATFDLALSIASSASLDLSPASKLVQRCLATDCLYVDVSSAATVATICRPFFNIFLAQERDAAVAAATSFNSQDASIGKRRKGIVVRCGV
jgi:hypothetical protein